MPRKPARCTTCDVVLDTENRYSAKHGKCKPCQRAYIREWKRLHRDRDSSYTRKWRARNPDRAKAHRVVAEAVQSGLLVRQPCEDCGDKKTHAHHDDYGQPVNVRWLCCSCHAAVHR